MQFNRLRLGPRLALGFGAVLALMLLMVALSVLEFEGASREFEGTVGCSAAPRCPSPGSA